MLRPIPSTQSDDESSSDRIARHAGILSHQLRVLREGMFPPEAKKSLRSFTSGEVSRFVGVSDGYLRQLTIDGLGPMPSIGAGGRRAYSLAQINELRQYLAGARPKEALSFWPRRRQEDKLQILAVANFKGGVSKTTSAMILAQGLSLRGHRVLAIDIDPQGSLTTLHGILPEAEVSEEMTIAPLCNGTSDDITPAIRSTYWDGIDLVAAAPFLFSAEFALPARQMQEAGARFWDVLNAGLEPVRDLYDVIVIDTPPSLSYVTINGLWAADGVIVPVPPSGLDFASSAQFWSLLADLGTNLDQQEPDGAQKVFDFLHVLLSRVDQADAASPAVRQWIQATYGEFVLPVEIPKTSVTSNKSAEFATVYDVQKYDGSAKTYKRAIDTYDRFVDLVEESVVEAWRARKAAT